MKYTFFTNINKFFPWLKYTTMGKASNYVKLCRPYQYPKNILIFFPLFFVGAIYEWAELVKALYGFLAFSIGASGVYILNDYVDIDFDRKHPTKKKRPLAAGTVSPTIALWLMGFLFILGLSSMWLLNKQAGLLFLMYILMNIGYIFVFKNIAILDVATIASGFIFRLLIGSSINNIELSPWIIILTFLLALFLAMSKRREDVLVYETSNLKYRKVISEYSLKFVDTVLTLLAAIITIAYIIYTITTPYRIGNYTQYLYITAFPVLLAMLTYLQILFVKKDSGSPIELLWRHKELLALVVIWLFCFAFLIYL